MLSRCWYRKRDTAKRAYFHGGRTSVKLFPPSPQNIKIMWDTTMIAKATRVMTLGATVSGTNRSRYSANGDHRYL